MIRHSASRLMLILAVLISPIYSIGTRIASGDSSAAPPPPAAPLDQSSPAPGGSAQMFGAFSVLGSTSTGQTLFMKLPAGQTLEAAITQTADELGKVFDAKPTISGAFANAQGKDKGGATLTAKLKGQEIKGSIFCGTGQNGGSATVILATPDTSKDELAALFSSMPAQLKMTTHKFPDGSGSIDLPDGWKTADQTASFGIGVQGPAGQSLAFSRIMPVNEPNSRIVRMAQQTYQIQLQNYDNQMRQYQQALVMHQQFPNTLMPREPQKPAAPNPDPNIEFPAFRFCRYCDGAEDVLKFWYPINEQIQKRAGKPYTTLDKIIEVFPADPNPLIPKSKAGLAYIAVTDHDGDKVTHLRALNRIATAPVTEGEVWQLSVSGMRAPDATFDRDLPVMNAIMNSVNLNMDKVNGDIKAAGESARKMGAEMFAVIQKNGRDFQDEQAVSFNRHEMQIAAREKAMHDSSSDYIEYVLGVRSVYDNATGRMHSVDLFNSNAIVDGMNAAANDPNRFVQIPLRYQR